MPQMIKISHLPCEGLGLDALISLACVNDHVQSHRSRTFITDISVQLSLLSHCCAISFLSVLKLTDLGLGQRSQELHVSLLH